MALMSRGGRFRTLTGLNSDLACILEDSIMNFFGTGTTRGSQCGVQFMMGKLFALEDFRKQLPVVDEDLGPALNDPLEVFAVKGKPANYSIEHDQSGRRYDASGDRVVASVHRILHRIAKHQQQNQVERRKLSNLTFSRDSQEQDQKRINNESPHDEFPPGQRSAPHGGECRMQRVECRVRRQKWKVVLPPRIELGSTV